jgi:exopolyphosphatase/guanosine-5'-triphosphate,3'-diphosphate pyrophosphatase
MPFLRPADSFETGASGQPDRPGHVLGALDLGTNNCRLLVARTSHTGFRIVDSFSRIVRLGEGLELSGRLSDVAIERTLEALKICARKIALRRVSHWRWVATEACRQASNGGEFLYRVKREVGLDLEVITGEQEARYALTGCQSLLDYEHDYALIFDVGGGSTELMWLRLGRNREPSLLAWTSVPCGVVSLSERYGGDRVSETVYQAMIDDALGLLRPFEAAHGIFERAVQGNVLMLGTSGTVTTVASVARKLNRYDRDKIDGCWLNPDQIRQTARLLASWSLAERQAHPCIGAGRADLVVAGCAIVEAIHRIWPATRIRVADRGVREGILHELRRTANVTPPKTPCSTTSTSTTSTSTTSTSITPTSITPTRRNA